MVSRSINILAACRESPILPHKPQINNLKHPKRNPYSNLGLEQENLLPNNIIIEFKVIHNITVEEKTGGKNDILIITKTSIFTSLRVRVRRIMIEDGKFLLFLFYLHFLGLSLLICIFYMCI